MLRVQATQRPSAIPAQPGVSVRCRTVLISGTIAMAPTAQIASSTPMKKNCPAMNQAIDIVTSRR